MLPAASLIPPVPECYSHTQMHGLLLFKPVAGGHADPGQRLFCGRRVRAGLHPRDARGATACGAGSGSARGAAAAAQSRRSSARRAAGRDALFAGAGLAGRAAGRADSRPVDRRCCRTRRFMATWPPWCSAFALITYFHVVAGELVPKSLALRRAEALAVAVAPPMLVFMAVVRPAVRLLSRSAAVDAARIRYPQDRARRIHPLRRGAEADCHRGAAAGPASRVPGDAGAPRSRTRRRAGARDHDSAAEDLLAALEHAA